jgi:hypothetical protein
VARAPGAARTNPGTRAAARASASTASLAVAGRSAGSLASIRVIGASSSIGKPSVDGAVGGVPTCFIITSITLGPSKGIEPTSARWTITPSE